MCLELPPLAPRVRLVMMRDVAEKEALCGSMNDQADVGADADRPEAFVLRLVEAMEVEARARRVHLQIERGGLDRLLLVAGQARQAVGEGVGDEELHGLYFFSYSRGCSGFVRRSARLSKRAF